MMVVNAFALIPQTRTDESLKPLVIGLAASALLGWIAHATFLSCTLSKLSFEDSVSEDGRQHNWRGASYEFVEASPSTPVTPGARIENRHITNMFHSVRMFPEVPAMIVAGVEAVYIEAGNDTTLLSVIQGILFGIMLVEGMFALFVDKERTPSYRLAVWLCALWYGGYESIPFNPVEPEVNEAALQHTTMLTVPTVAITIWHAVDAINSTTTWLAPMMGSACIAVILYVLLYLQA